jgi:hypothetical protein
VKTFLEIYPEPILQILLMALRTSRQKASLSSAMARMGKMKSEKSKNVFRNLSRTNLTNHIAGSDDQQTEGEPKPGHGEAEED